MPINMPPNIEDRHTSFGEESNATSRRRFSLVFFFLTCLCLASINTQALGKNQMILQEGGFLLFSFSTHIYV
jgi:hypothetical protein